MTKVRIEPGICGFTAIAERKRRRILWCICAWRAVAPPCRR